LQAVNYFIRLPGIKNEKKAPAKKLVLAKNKPSPIIVFIISPPSTSIISAMNETLEIINYTFLAGAFSRHI